MNKGAPHSAVAIREWMDGLKLCMGDRCVSERWDVGAGNESNQIVDSGWHPVMVRRDELSTVRAVVAAADPHLPLAPPTRDVRGAVTQESIMQIQDGWPVESVSE